VFPIGVRGVRLGVTTDIHLSHPHISGTTARHDQPVADPPRPPPATYADEGEEDQDPDDPDGHQRVRTSRYEQAKARLMGQDMSEAFLHKAAALNCPLIMS
jgi:hypothetical protein